MKSPSITSPNRLAERTEHDKNRRILKEVGKKEKKHYDFWKNYTHQDVGPKRLKIWFYLILSKIFGL